MKPKKPARKNQKNSPSQAKSRAIPTKRKFPTGDKGTHKRPEKIYSEDEADSRLFDLFRNHGFSDYPHPKRRQLVQFYRLLMDQQLTENFTRLTQLKDIGIKHFIDCLMVTELTELRFPLLDMGTGPGFPGIPLKIEHPEEKMILADGVRKRIDFLKKVRSKLNLKQLDLMGRNISAEFSYPVRGVITRAVKDISDTLEDVSQCLEVGGRLYLMKGPNVDAEVKAAKQVWSPFYKLAEDHEYKIPNSPHERRLLVYEKIKNPELSGGQEQHLQKLQEKPLKAFNEED